MSCVYFLQMLLLTNHSVPSEPWVNGAGKSNMRRRGWVSNITSFGFSDIGFSPWASRTCSEMKGGQKHSEVKGSSKANMSRWTSQPFGNLFLQANGTFPAGCFQLRRSHVNSVWWSYIFGICPAALWGPHFALSHQPQGQVRKGCQVPTGTHGSFLGDKGEAGSCRSKVSWSASSISVRIKGSEQPQWINARIRRHKWI